MCLATYNKYTCGCKTRPDVQECPKWKAKQTGLRKLVNWSKECSDTKRKRQHWEQHCQDCLQLAQAATLHPDIGHAGCVSGASRTGRTQTARGVDNSGQPVPKINPPPSHSRGAVYPGGPSQQSPLYTQAPRGNIIPRRPVPTRQPPSTGVYLPLGNTTRSQTGYGLPPLRTRNLTSGDPTRVSPLTSQGWEGPAGDVSPLEESPIAPLPHGYEPWKY